jgi:transcriptional regulator with XRE-family HTH domain
MKASRTSLQQRIGSVIRRLRESKNWSQEAFADHIEMHRAQYGFIEQGRRDLRLSTLERVARGLGEPMSEILREAEGS